MCENRFNFKLHDLLAEPYQIIFNILNFSPMVLFINIFSLVTSQ